MAAGGLAGVSCSPRRLRPGSRPVLVGLRTFLGETPENGIATSESGPLKNVLADLANDPAER